MYVCICNAIRDQDLRAAACRTAGDAETVYAALGYRPQCRQCLEEAEDVLAEARSGKGKLHERLCEPALA